MSLDRPLAVDPAVTKATWIGLVILVAGALAYTSLLTGGQRLFDNDYDWIASAGAGWVHILGQILDPIPEDWGFQHRPVQVLCVKVLHALFGYSPAPYYAFKGLLFAAAVGGIVLFCLSAGFGSAVAFTASGVFALSAPDFASVLWVSDFELLAQLFILAALGGFLALERGELGTRAGFRLYLGQTVIFLLTLLGHRAKGSAKLVPLFILGYLLISNRKALVRYLPLLVLIIVTIVPVFHLLEDPVPPFAPFSEDRSQGWMWKPANLTTLSVLLVGNAHPVTGTAGPDGVHSLLGVLCPVLLWASLGAALWLYRGRSELAPLPRKARNAAILTGVWLVVVIASFASFPRLPVDFMARYVAGALVPASILVALLLGRAATALSASRAVPLLALVVVGHGLVNFGHTRTIRESLGQIMIVYDRARAAIAETVQDADVLLLGFPYSYNRPLTDGNRYIQDLDSGLDVGPSRPLYALVPDAGQVNRVDHRSTLQRLLPALRMSPERGPGYRVDVRPVRTFHGLTDGIYDRWIYRSTESFLAVLYHVALEPIDPNKGIGQ